MQLDRHRWPFLELRQEVDQVVEVGGLEIEGVTLVGVNVGNPKNDMLAVGGSEFLA